MVHVLGTKQKETIICPESLIYGWKFRGILQYPCLYNIQSSTVKLLKKYKIDNNHQTSFGIACLRILSLDFSAFCVIMKYLYIIFLSVGKLSDTKYF